MGLVAESNTAPSTPRMLCLDALCTIYFVVAAATAPGASALGWSSLLAQDGLTVDEHFGLREVFEHIPTFEVSNSLRQIMIGAVSGFLGTEACCAQDE